VNDAKSNQPPPPPPANNHSGKWVVIVLVATGIIAGAVAMKFRKLPVRGTTRPSTTQAVDW
jgi:hypothetical protein